MAFFTRDMQALFAPPADTPPAATSARSDATRPRSSQPAGDKAAATCAPREGKTSLHASQPSTAKSSPAMKPQAHGPPPPAALSHATTTAPPHPQRRSRDRRTSPAVASSPSRSLTPASSSDSDDDFVYVFDHVNTTEEAVERIRAVQQPERAAAKQTKDFFSRRLGDSATSLTELTSTAATTSRKMRGELPATMEEFYECPRYTVSLTAARGALFSDALSGFHSYVAREEAQRHQLRALQQQQQQQHQHRTSGKPATAAEQTTQYVRTYDTQGGVVRTSVVPAFSPSMTQEWHAALDVSAGPAERSEKRSHGEARCTASAPAPARGAPPAASAPLTIAAASTAPVREESAAGQEHASGSPRVPASYMFLMRSRDTEAMSPVSSPAHPAASLPVPFEASGARATDAAAPLSAPKAPPAAQQHADPTPAPPPPPPAPTPAAMQQTARLETAQLQALLQERIYQRARVPVVFRFRYSPEYGETIDEVKHRHQLRDRVLQNHERLAGSRGLTQAERHDIMSRYADPNSLEHEWPYVWEQFARDIPRETLFIEDTPYHDADDALAAILSYLEYCYDRSQKHIKEKSAAALAAANSARVAPAPAAAAAAAPPPASEDKGFFESFLSAGTAALKGAVVTMRSSLPDFVGDPLLAVSGYDPALYHASLLFPADPKARSDKVFAAVREVVLASQQSFMGFPYQLLCEQVGTERLGLALEALEQEQAADDELDDETETERTAQVTAQVTPLDEEGPSASPSNVINVSAPIPISRSDGGELLGREMSASLHSPLHGSRVLRIYQSFSSPSSLTRRDGDAAHHHRQHTSHAVDEWNVSSSSECADDTAPSALSPDESPATPTATGTPPPPPSSASASPTPTAAFAEALLRPATGEGERKQLPRPPPLVITAPQPATSSTSAAAAAAAAREEGAEKERRRRQNAAQRRRERRRRRRGQLPLLVGEPRAFEFTAFLELVRSRVLAKEVRDERKAREQQRRERVQRTLERQREQWRSAPSSRQGSRQASSASLDTMKHTDDAAPPTAGLPSKHSTGAAAAAAEATPVPRRLFREDVEGSAYLIPNRLTPPPAAFASVPRSPLSAASEREAALPPETRGMRICLYFDETRNAPVVVVNKLFRLFTMPGVGGLTTSEDEGEAESVAAHTEAGSAAEKLEEEEGHHEKGANAAHLPLAHASAPLPRALPPRPVSREKSLLLLIQVQFALFTQEEAEVRWKWWKL